MLLVVNICITPKCKEVEEALSEKNNSDQIKSKQDQYWMLIMTIGKNHLSIRIEFSSPARSSQSISMHHKQ